MNSRQQGKQIPHLSTLRSIAYADPLGFDHFFKEF